MIDVLQSQLSFEFFEEQPQINLPETFEPQGSELAQPTQRRYESDLYEPIAAWLKGYWAPREDLREPLVEIIANQGRRPTGGMWTRPDLVVIGICAYPFVPGKNLDLSTFEVKKSLEEGIAGVYEAAAHSAFAHRSFLVIHLEDRSIEHDELYCRIVNECERFGLGLITLNDPSNFTTYRTVIDANLRSPNTALMNRFIGTQISESARQKLLTMLR